MTLQAPVAVPPDDLSAAVLNGAYLDPLKFALVVGWHLATIAVIGAVARENARLRINRSVWSFAVVLGAAASLVPLLAIPFFPIGAFFAFGFFLPVLMGYVHLARNPRVKPAEQLLTDEHLARIGRSMLTGVGLSAPNGTTEGPIVRLKPPRSLLRRPETAAAVGTMQSILEDALEARASDLQLDVLRDRASLRRRIDGVWGTPTALEIDVAAGLSEVVAKLSAPEGGDARRINTASFPAKIGRETHLIHTTGLSSVVRRRTNLRLPTPTGPKKLTDLGLGEREFGDLSEGLKHSSGLILVCGPPSSGRRTTLQAMVGHIDHFTRRVLAVDEPGRPFELAQTVETLAPPSHAPTDIAEALKHAVGQKCDVLLVGRIENAECASIVLEAAKDRLVLAAVDAENAVAGLVKLAEFGVDRATLADRARVAVGQRLPRKLCVDCREPYRPNPEALRRANLGRPTGDVLYRANPVSAADCETCRGTGFVGCSPLFETLPIASRLRNLLRAGASEREMILEARKEGAVSPTEEALSLLAAGITSAEELRRVLQTGRADKEDA
jgi:general secretion pathway protein E